MRISPIMLQGRMVIPRIVARGGEKCVQLTFLKNLSAVDQAKAMKVHGLKIVKTNFADEHFELVFSFFPWLSSVFPYEFVLVSLSPCHSWL